MALADGFAVRPDALAVGAGAVGPAAQELRQLAGSLAGVGGLLADAVGQPAAADASLEFTARWVGQLRHLEALVDGLGMALALAGELYRDGDREVAGAFGAGP
jgi:uncharacterized protein YukE